MRSFFTAIGMLIALGFMTVMVLYQLQYAIPIIIGFCLACIAQAVKKGDKLQTTK